MLKLKKCKEKLKDNKKSLLNCRKKHKEKQNKKMKTLTVKIIK